MGKGKIFIFSGLPGTGKSTLAGLLSAKLPAFYVRVDTLEQSLKDNFPKIKLWDEGYRLAHQIARDNLFLGNSVVADSVNPWVLSRDGWDKVAVNAGAEFLNIEVVCSDKAEHRRRVEERVSSVPALKLPTWDDVLKRDYQEWDRPRLVLDTSGKSVESSLNELMSVLNR